MHTAQRMAATGGRTPKKRMLPLSSMKGRTVVALLQRHFRGIICVLVLFALIYFIASSGTVSTGVPGLSLSGVSKQSVSVIVPWRNHYTGSSMLERYLSLANVSALRNVKDIELIVSTYDSIDLSQMTIDAQKLGLPVKVVPPSKSAPQQRGPALSVYSYSKLVNRGLKLISSSSSYIMVLSPTHVPDEPMAMFIDKMVGNATLYDATLLGATTAANEEIMHASEPQVQDREEYEQTPPPTPAPPPKKNLDEQLNEFPDLNGGNDYDLGDLTPAPTPVPTPKPRKIHVTYTEMPTVNILSTSSTDSIRYVLDHGLKVQMGRFNGRLLPYITRRLAGFETRDVRALTLDKVDMVTPYCFLIERNAFLKLGGMKDDDLITSIDQIASGSIAVSVAKLAVARLVAQFIAVQRVVDSVTIEQMRRVGTPMKVAYKNTFEALMNARRQIETVVGVAQWEKPKFRSRIHYPGVTEEWEAKIKAVLRSNEVPDALVIFSKMIEASCGLVRKATFSNHEAIREDMAGWDLSMRVNQQKLNVFVSGNLVNFDATGFPEKVQDYFREHPTPLVQASMPASKLMMETWGRQLRRMHPFYRYEQAPLRLVWDAFCCGCCGFANEIVHFLYPLQERYVVNLMPGPTCFCPGFPSSVEQTLHRMHSEKDQFPMETLQDDEIVVWVSHTDPMSFKNSVFDQRKPDYIVGRSMYEFTKIDSNWVEASNQDCDEIWVPAKFVQYVFESSGVDPEKLVIVPEAIDTNFFNPASHDKLPLPPSGPISGSWRSWCNRPNTTDTSNNYKFFSNFKWEPRKGWDIMFRAYFEAFKKDEPVSLYILSHYWFSGPPETYGDKHNVTLILDEIRAELGIDDFSHLPHFCLLAADLSEKNVAELYNSVDAFVLPTRGEGWGLPTIQAMSMGLPTISTYWGGQQEFMTQETSFMIPVDSVEEIPFDSVYRWKLAKKWATPSFEATRDFMRIIFDKPKAARKVGERAREHIVSHFSEEAIADVVDLRLQTIREKVLAKRGELGGAAVKELFRS